MEFNSLFGTDKALLMESIPLLESLVGKCSKDSDLFGILEYWLYMNAKSSVCSSTLTKEESVDVIELMSKNIIDNLKNGE